MTEGIIDKIFDQYIHSDKCSCSFCKSFRKMRRELIKEIKDNSGLSELAPWEDRRISVRKLIGDSKE